MGINDGSAGLPGKCWHLNSNHTNKTNTNTTNDTTNITSNDGLANAGQGCPQGCARRRVMICITTSSAIIVTVS